MARRPGCTDTSSPQGEREEREEWEEEREEEEGEQEEGEESSSSEESSTSRVGSGAWREDTGGLVVLEVLELVLDSGVELVAAVVAVVLEVVMLEVAVGFAELGWLEGGREVTGPRLSVHLLPPPPPLTPLLMALHLAPLTSPLPLPPPLPLTPPPLGLE